MNPEALLRINDTWIQEFHEKESLDVGLHVHVLCLRDDFFALLQQTHIFWTGNTSQRSDERQLRGSSSSANFFLTSQVPAKEELGRAGWTILHRIAAKFSEEPVELEKENMKQFLTLFAKLYPCQIAQSTSNNILGRIPRI